MSDSEIEVAGPSRPRRRADDDINGMIEEVIAENPAAARKFLVTTPAIVKKQAQKRQSKRKADDNNNNDERSPAKPTKKAKSSKQKKVEDDDESDTPPPTRITYYIEIPKLSTTSKTKRGKGTEEVLQKGPFTLDSTAPYPEFLSALAAELPCRKENINESQILWKSKKPIKGDRLPLGKARGYEAMTGEMEAKKADARTVLLFMPAPTRPMEEDTPWPKDGPVPAQFDYSELEAVGASDSIQAQKTAFNKATKDHRAELEERFPIGNHPSFPHLCVYTEPQTKFLFELNSSRLGVWSAGMGQGTATVTTPPPSRFFDAVQRIKIIPTTPATPAGAIGPAPSFPPPQAPTSLADALLASILTQNGGGLGALFPHLNHAVPVAPPPIHPQSRTAPPSPIKQHNVTLERFCTLYNIHDADQALLKDVGFLPGDQTDGALNDDLKSVGFTFFGWKRIHNANMRFKVDLSAGNFD